MNIIEYAFYIHGVVPDRLPGSHEDQYGELHQLHCALNFAKSSD